MNSSGNNGNRSKASAIQAGGSTRSWGPGGNDVVTAPAIQSVYAITVSPELTL